MKTLSFCILLILSNLTLAKDFVEVNPKNQDEVFLSRMKKALKYLQNSEHSIGPKTYQFITKGKAQVDLISDLTYSDYLQVLSDFKREGTPLAFTKEDYPKLSSDPKVSKEFEEYVDGYMWENRIYVSAKLKPYELAQTLVHEVNHVINESHIPYYISDYNAFMEEYRAFYAESLFTAKDPQNAEEFKSLKEHVAELYAFPLELIEQLPDVPTGKILP